MEKQIEYYEKKLNYETDSWDLFDGLSKNENIIVVDARAAEAYELEHIPSSINVPHKTMSEDTTKELDRKATIVIYCDGIGCNASTRGALKMARLGFKVKELMGGIEWWKFDGYATEGTQATSGSLFECAC